MDDATIYRMTFIDLLPTNRTFFLLHSCIWITLAVVLLLLSYHQRHRRRVTQFRGKKYSRQLWNISTGTLIDAQLSIMFHLCKNSRCFNFYSNPAQTNWGDFALEITEQDAELFRSWAYYVYASPWLWNEITGKPDTFFITLSVFTIERSWVVRL